MKRISCSAPIEGTDFEVIWWPQEALPPSPTVRKPSRNDAFPALAPALEQVRAAAFFDRRFQPGTNNNVDAAGQNPFAAELPAPPVPAAVTAKNRKSSPTEAQRSAYFQPPPDVDSMSNKVFVQHVLDRYGRLLTDLSAHHRCAAQWSKVGQRSLPKTRLMGVPGKIDASAARTCNPCRSGSSSIPRH